ncbi:MAG: hypothetical protein WCO77_10210 [bacterium]
MKSLAGGVRRKGGKAQPLKLGEPANTMKGRGGVRNERFPA